MKFIIAKASDHKYEDSKDFNSLDKLLTFIEDSFVKPEDRPLEKGEDSYRYSDYDTPKVIIEKEWGKWFITIYDDYVE